MKKEVLYPAARAAITGLFAALLAVTVTYFRGDPSWAFGGLVGAIVAFIAWVLMQLPKVQRAGLSSKPEPARVSPKQQVTKVLVTGDSSSFTAGRWLDLPLSSAELRQVAKWLNNGADFSHAGLAGPGRPLSRSQFESLRTEFINRNLVCWRDPACHNRGLVLTKAGRSVMRYFSPNNGKMSPGGHKYTKAAHTHIGRGEGLSESSLQGTLDFDRVKVQLDKRGLLER